MNSLNVKCETWGRDTFELMNYESSELYSSELEIDNSGFIYREGNEIKFEKNRNERNSHLLLKVNKHENSNYILNTNPFELDDKQNFKSFNNCWFSFRTSKMENKPGKYRINKGDIIRFGRITMRVKDIYKSKYHSNSIDLDRSYNYMKDGKNVSNNKNQLTHSTIVFGKINKKIEQDNNEQNIRNNDQKINIHQSINKMSVNKLPKICRICYTEEEPDSKNPLVQPCKCSGSMKYIHLNCLKQWLYTKSCTRLQKNNNFSIFIIKPVECELCKTKLPDFIKHNGKLYELLDFRNEFENHLTIESVTIDKNNNKCLYVINLDDNYSIKIGRGTQSDLTLSDISVSRVHSIITILNQNIYIEDNNSKFGTLILVQSPNLQLVENLPLFIQVGRTFLDCRVSESFSFFPCCCSSEKFCMNYYYDQNLEPRLNNLRTIFTVKMDDSEINESKSNENKDNHHNNRYNNFSNDENDNIKILLKDQQNSLAITGETKYITNINTYQKGDNISKSVILESESEN